MPDDPDGKKPSPYGVPVVALSERKSARPHRDHARPKSAADAPAFVEEEYTDKYDGEELRAMRARRPTRERLERLEDKHDELRDEFRREVGSMKVAIAGMGGQMEVIPRLVDAMESAIQNLQQREHVTFTAKVDVDKAAALDQIDARADARKVDTHKAKAKWDIITKVIAVAATITAAISTAIAAGC